MNLHITPTVYFVPTSKALTQTLFRPTGTASGTYKVRKNGVLFLKPDGEPFAFLVANRHGERFFVTAYRFPGDGKLRYMHCLTDEGEKLLGVSGMSFIQEREVAEKTWHQIAKGNTPSTGAFRITHTRGEIIATLPAGDDLAAHAASAYGFILNTSDRRERPHSAAEFATAIADYCDSTEPRTAAIVAHLHSLP